MRHIRVLLSIFVLVLWSSVVLSAQAGVEIGGELRRWHKVTLTFDGINTTEDASTNPFLDYRLNVTFTNGTKTYVVPGYFAADGNAANTGASSGSKWRVHFTPDEIGTWTYTASFRTGSNIAVDLNPNAGTPTSFDGTTGTFNIQETNKSGQDLRGKGLLRYVGGHHMQFAGTGEYFLKGGADSPENFLAYNEFDGTYDTGGIRPNFLHAYAPHAGDWQAGDPVWKGDKGKNIIGAVNYLASQGMNSIYFITYNIDGGDGRDTWPWTSDTVRDRFDVSKLDQWEIVFSHMTENGIQLHVLTQEHENDQKLGGNSSLNNIRKLYYRELVARFAHHPALQWNLGEENDNSDAELADFSAYIRALDPYDHPITVHTYYNLHTSFDGGVRPGKDYYDSIINNYPTILDATSIQGDGSKYNQFARDLRQRSANAGHPWVIYGDEQGPAVNKDMNNVDQLRKSALWGNLMGGGAGIEWYFGYQAEFGDVQSEDWRVAQPFWEDTRHALDFFQGYLPFWEMTPNNNLVNDSDTYVLATEGEIYALYSNAGAPGTLDLKNNSGTFEVFWYNPRSGGALQTGSVTQISGPGVQSVGQPPNDASQDWAVLVRRVGSTGPTPTPSATATTDPNQPTATATVTTDPNQPTATPTPDTGSGQRITSLVLIDALNDVELFTLQDGAVIGVNTLPVGTDQLNIRAITSPDTVGSVRFVLNNSFVTTESVAPYALFGDTNGNYTPGSLGIGLYSLQVTPYAASGGGGEAGETLTINFEVVAEFVATPTDIATATPTPLTTTDPGEPTATGTAVVLTPTQVTVTPLTETVQPTQAVTNQPTATPTTLPDENINVEVPTGTSPVVTWVPTNPPALWYEVVLVNNGGAVIFSQWFAAETICNASLCTVDLGAWLPFGLDAGSYTVKINAWYDPDDDGNGDIVPIYDEPVNAPETPVDASTGRVTITLPDSPQISWIRVWIGFAGSFIEVPHFNRSGGAAGWYEKATEMNCDGTTCALLTDAHPVNGSYVVYMQYWDGQSVSAWGGPFAFTLNMPAPTVPTNLNVTPVPLGMTWNAGSHTTWYQIWIGTPGTFQTTYIGWHSATDLGCDDGLCTFTPDAALSSGTTYTWYVQSWGPGGLSQGGTAEGWIAGAEFQAN